MNQEEISLSDSLRKFLDLLVEEMLREDISGKNHESSPSK